MVFMQTEFISPKFVALNPRMFHVNGVYRDCIKRFFWNIFK